MRAIVLGLLVFGTSALPWGAMAQTTAEDVALRQAQADLAKTEIANLQSALTAIEPAKVKVGPVTAPDLKATSYRRLIDDLEKLQPFGIGERPLGSSDTVILRRPGIEASVETYQAVNARIRTGGMALRRARENLDHVLNPTTREFTESIIGPATAVAVANLATSFAAAWKAQYGFGTSELASSQKLAEAFVQKTLLSQRVKVLDPMKFRESCYEAGTTLDAVEPACEGMPDAGTLLVRARALKDAIDENRDKLAEESGKLPPPPGDGKKDPKKQQREALAAFGKAVNDIDESYRKLFAADAANAVPFMIALQGESISRVLSGENAFLLEVTPLVSDVDTVARDKLLSGYNVAMLGTTAFQWTLTDGRGNIRASDVVTLGDDEWQGVEMPWKRRNPRQVSAPR